MLNPKNISTKSLVEDGINMTHLRNIVLLFVLGTTLAVAAIVVTPRSASAAAGSGGGGGSSGCSTFNYSTCFGAVWRYYRTTSNSYPIKNVGAGYTYVQNCASTGGFFAYVLPHRNFPNDPGQVRSWQIGPVDGESGNRSEFFGGWTRYRVYSNPSDPIPTNPSPGDYSWYSVEKAFAQTRSLGQNGGYSWNGSSTLGWFCYRGLDYNLNPAITGTPSSSEGGSSVNLSPSVNNTGSTTSSTAQWQVNTFTINPGRPVPGGGTSGTAPAAFYGNGATLISGGSGSRSFPRNTTAVNVPQQQIGEYIVGTRICYALSVQPVSHTSNQWRHSTPFCVIIAKKPKVQVHGGDVSVGKTFVGETASGPRRIVASTTTKRIGAEMRTFGSWSEYSARASGQITGLGTGSAYNGGLLNATTCGANLLTFSNTNGSSCTASPNLGSYVSGKSIPSVVTAFPTSASTPVFSSLADAALRRVEVANSDVAIAGGTVQRGDWLVLNAEGRTVTITGNILYTGDTLQYITDIPQVVIIANRINIIDTVTQVDAWLVATGTNGVINTCSNQSSLNAGVCDDPLLVNGPVMAKSLLLRRTAGSGIGGSTGEPAEVFNLRPDAYLWSIARAQSANRAQSVYIRELPPRF